MIRRETIDDRRALVVYLNAAFEPVEPDKATLVKVRFENGEVVFGTHEPQDTGRGSGPPYDGKTRR